MDEKLIIVSIDNEVVDSFPKIFSPLGIHFYCVHNNINLIECLEFEAFVYVICEWR